MQPYNGTTQAPKTTVIALCVTLTKSLCYCLSVNPSYVTSQLTLSSGSHNLFVFMHTVHRTKYGTLQPAFIYALLLWHATTTIQISHYRCHMIIHMYYHRSLNNIYPLGFIVVYLDVSSPLQVTSNTFTSNAILKTHID